MVVHLQKDYVTQQPNTSEFEQEWRTNSFQGRSQDGEGDGFSNFSYIPARGYEIRKGQPAKSGGSIAIDFRIINIQTGWYVKWEEAQIA